MDGPSARSPLDVLIHTASRSLISIEELLWFTLAVALVPVAIRAIRAIHEAGQTRTLLAVLGLAIALRCAVPWEPIYYHYPVMKLGLPSWLYERPNTYLTFPLRLLVFDLGGGFDAALAFNLFAGIASIVLLWYAALVAGHAPRACALFGVLLAVTPMYVRQSASDSAYLPIFFLYSTAAAAYGSLVKGARIDAAALLIAAVPLGMVIRGESTWGFLGVPLFWLTGTLRMRDVLPRHLLPMLLLAASGLFGSLAAFDILSASFGGERLQPQLMSIVFGIVVQVFCVPAPFFPSFFPPTIALPIWLTSIHQLRQRAWNELASTYLPIWFARVPFLFGSAFMGGLGDTGYPIIALPFMLLASARGADQLYLRYQRGDFLVSVRSRRIFLSASAAVSAIWCIHAYGYRYIEGQEMTFLRRELPRHDCTVLVLWDPDSFPGDDCCLSLPYPPLWAELPRTRWIVITLADLDRPEYIRSLEFDLYYPGSTLQLVDSTTWVSRRWPTLFEDEERLGRQREGLRRHRELDALVRREHKLEPWRQQTVKGHTPSFAHFKDDTVTFRIDRAVR